MLNSFKFDPWEPFQANFYVFFDMSSSFLSISLVSDKKTCSRLILYFPYPSLGIIQFTKEWRMIFRNQDICILLVGCCRSQAFSKDTAKEVHMYTCIHVCIHVCLHIFILCLFYVYWCIWGTVTSHCYLQFQCSTTRQILFFYLSIFIVSFPTVRNLTSIILSIFTCLISVPTCNQPPISTTNLFSPTSQYGWSPNPTQATTAMLGYYHIHLSCVDILLHPGLGDMYHAITPCGCPPHPCLGFDPYFWAIVVNPPLRGCLPCSAPMNGFWVELGSPPPRFY